MKKNTILVKALATFSAAAFAVSSQAGTPVPMDTVAPADDLGMTLSLGYDSSYIFRGVNYGDNLIWGEVAKTFALTEQLSLDLGVWYATLADQDYDELDLIGGLTYDFGAFQVGAGYIWYYFPRTSDNTGDIVASLSSSVGPVDLGFNYAYDHSLIKGHYLELGASSTIALTDKISLEPGVAIAYEIDYNTVGNGFSAVVVGLAMPIALTESATLTPYISGNLPIDILEAAGEDNSVYGGVSLSVSF